MAAASALLISPPHLIATDAAANPAMMDGIWTSSNTSSLIWASQARNKSQFHRQLHSHTNDPGNLGPPRSVDAARRGLWMASRRATAALFAFSLRRSRWQATIADHTPTRKQQGFQTCPGYALRPSSGFWSTEGLANGLEPGRLGSPAHLL
ncbi:hypothetical protein TARUN_4943 [Trichoderma arundinaceum]|uniref:Uncharacterized protein n=1 Tax=Trichoderma arundinaceum TaxID=490622 RepID=A0A395NN32_TRIAR|nr:hypothetical protein TARUN_4943 [Trichoderma arundinaceum]